MFYEMGLHLVKYSRLSDYRARYELESGQLGACRRSGIDLIAAWTDDIGIGNRFRYLVKWESMEERTLGWAKFGSDDLWNSGRDATEKDDGPWTRDTWKVFLKLSPFSPELRIVGNVQELLTFEANPGRLPQLNAFLANTAITCFRDHKISVVGVWSTDVGNTNQVLCMLGFDNLEERESAWEGLGADARWLGALRMNESGEEFIHTHVSTILRPFPFMFQE